MSRPLSQTWARETHEALGRTSDITVRLALALGPVKACIRVVDDSQPPMTVSWAQEGENEAGGRFSMSYTDFKNGRIRINPLPITGGQLTPAEALDVVTGFAMHEASHAKESRDRFKVLFEHDSTGREVARFRPLRIAAYLLNLVEDVRVEACTARRWPGFADYFTAVLAYMWTGQKPKAYGPDIASKCATAFLACRYPDRVLAHLDPSFGPEIEWWQAWQADYLTDRVSPAETVQRGLDHLALDTETKDEMEKLATEEREAEAAGEKLRQQLERLMREGIEGAPVVCVTDAGEVIPLDGETAAKVTELVAEGLVEMRPIILGHGVANPPLRVRKPVETAYSTAAYIGRPDATVAALRTALVFRQAIPEHQVKLLKRGEIDEEELWRWGAGDRRVYSERVIEARPDVLFGLLVDLSGSMSGSGSLQTAQQLAQLFVWSFHDQPGIRTYVWGHTGDTDATAADVFRIWEPGDPLRRLGLITTLPHSNNYDGIAIGWCVNEMRSAREPQKVLIVLSDGLPSGHGYGGTPARRHMRSVVEWGRRQGVDVIQIAIDEDLRPDEQAEMFGPANWLPFTTAAALPKTLARLMARFTR